VEINKNIIKKADTWSSLVPKRIHIFNLLLNFFFYVIAPSIGSSSAAELFSHVGRGA
jgi:hypothetical protein